LLNSIGIDRGHTSDREISVNIFTGSPSIGVSTPATSQQVALPCNGLTFRHMFLPRASKAVRQQVVAEELSYSLPFSLADAHYGMVERGEEAWVVVASDAVVAPIKDLYPRAALEAEPLCYLRAAKAAGIQNALVVDFGASKTVFCGLENGSIGSVRVLLRGGERLTEEVMEAASIPRDKAEILKREEGVHHKAVRQFYLELVEVALLPSPIPYRNVLLCGGGSATPGLLKLLSDLWGADVDVEPFPLPGDLLPTDHVVAFGAALAGRPSAQRLQMDHSFRHIAAGGSGPLLVAPLVLVALLMLLMVVSTETRLRGAEQKEQQMRASLVEAIAPVVPKAKDLKSEELVKALKDQLATQKEVARSSPARIMTTMGKGAEAVVNKDDASLTSIIFEDSKLKWEGFTKTLEESEDIRESLEKVMDAVEQVRTRPYKEGFVFQIEGKPRDL
jgi:hypothetical protein